MRKVQRRALRPVPPAAPAAVTAAAVVVETRPRRRGYVCGWCGTGRCGYCKRTLRQRSERERGGCCVSMHERRP